MKKLVKKSMCVLLSFAMLLILASCNSSTPTTTGSSSESAAPAKSSESESNVATVKEIDYPTKQIQWIVPYPAGGGTDLSSRIFQQYLDPELGKGSLLTNMAGSAGTVGSKEVLNAAPDGYTLLTTFPGVLIPYILGTANFNYDDFEVICQFATQVHGLVVKSDSPYKTLEDLLNAAKKNPGTINIGGSFNSLQQIALMELKEKSGADFNIVEIGGTSIKAPELLSDRVDAYIDSPSAFASYINSGEFRCVAVFSQERDKEFFPDVPTAKECGYDIVYDLSFGLIAPKGTPPEIVKKISAAAKIACESEDYKAAQAKLLTHSSYLDGAEYKSVLDELLESLQTTMKNLK